MGRQASGTNRQAISVLKTAKLIDWYLFSTKNAQISWSQELPGSVHNDASLLSVNCNEIAKSQTWSSVNELHLSLVYTPA